jgi:hypothetical protein
MRCVSADSRPCVKLIHRAPPHSIKTWVGLRVRRKIELDFYRKMNILDASSLAAPGHHWLSTMSHSNVFRSAVAGAHGVWLGPTRATPARP